MNALTKAAKHSMRKQTFENYTIAVICGIVLGVMFGVAV
jgi:F0F1-type ATP synthase assembly protein I